MSVNGKSAQVSLDLGGFGISRFTFDDFLYRKALEKGVKFLLNTEAEQIFFANDKFEVRAGDKVLKGQLIAEPQGRRPCRILISEVTAQLLDNRFQLEGIGEVALKGKAQALSAFRVVP